MKSTGIIRRIDDLGRVVIPKEIRVRLGLKDGDPLELYYDNGGICFVPYAISECYEERIHHLITLIKEEECELPNKYMVISALEIANKLLKGDNNNEQ